MLESAHTRRRFLRLLSAVCATVVSAPVAIAQSPKLDFPVNGKAISIIVPFGAGGGNDLTARIVADALQRELEVPVNVLNRPGANTVVGMSRLSRANPDGYTLAMTAIPSAITPYLSPTIKTIYGRKDIQLICGVSVDPVIIVVKADSTYKTIADLVDAANANPDKVTVASGGTLNVTHIATLRIAQLTGVKFLSVQFDSGAQQLAAVLGGHVDATSTLIPDALSFVKSGQVRVLGILDRQESRYLPGVKTLEAQGISAFVATSRFLVAPAGTPKEVVEFLSNVMKKVVQSSEVTAAMEKLSGNVFYMDTAQAAKYWADAEEQVKPFIKTTY
jgi:tripartite-type tricarboxylate transporter receptor subunit TctC